VGGFSLSASKVAKAVHLFEPDSANFNSIEKNFRSIRNATLNQMGLYNSNARLLLNISTSSVEHSFLTPDNKSVVRQEEVAVTRLDTYCMEHGIQSLDFLKIEAEGAELEVHEGLGDIRPRKLAVDVSPERDGLSPAAEFRRRLAAQGYQTRQRGHVLFAVR
jgi:FkbM family methyltransferase